MIALADGLRGRILALSLLALLPAMFALVCVPPVLGLYEARQDRVEERVQLAQRYRALAGALPALRKAEKTWRDRSGGDLLLAGSSDALAAAALQSALKDMADDAGAELSSSQSLPTRAADNFRRIGIRIVLTGNLESLVGVLRQIETARPLLSAGDFDIDAASGEPDDRQDPNLSVTLDVYGFRAG